MHSVTDGPSSGWLRSLWMVSQTGPQRWWRDKDTHRVETRRRTDVTLRSGDVETCVECCCCWLGGSTEPSPLQLGCHARGPINCVCVVSCWLFASSEYWPKSSSDLVSLQRGRGRGGAVWQLTPFKINIENNQLIITKQPKALQGIQTNHWVRTSSRVWKQHLELDHLGNSAAPSIDLILHF